MFERFLQGATSSNTSAPEKPQAVPPAPAPSAPSPEVIESPEEPEEEVQANVVPPAPPSAPMSDSINPSAKPPMAYHPAPAQSLSSEPEEEVQEVEEVEEEAPSELDEEEAPEDALPVDEEPEEEMSPPEPPSFLRGSSSSHKEVKVEEELDREESKKPVIQPTMGPVSEPDIVRGVSLHTVDFADIWFTPEGIAYVRDKNTRFALTPIETEDLEDFHKTLEQGFTGMSSYAVRFAGDSYRVERVNTVDGLQYNCRKMPTTTPEIETLGFEPAVVKHLTSLGRASGLLLFAGPTGQGKTTTVSALMKRFLDTDGGFLYTIEDPPEMPLSGIYHAKNGGLGLCKQVPVENDQWGAGLRSALRSKPRYILVGEIRTPETASQCLVAATSGHLVLSTIHANGVEDALNSMIKYAASTGLDNSLVADLLARGILGVVHQRLEGTTKLKLIYESAFANPNAQAACQMRMAIRDTNINLATYMEQQKTRMERGLPMFRE